MTELWIPNFSDSTSRSTVYDDATKAQTKINNAPVDYRMMVGKHFADILSTRIAHLREHEILLATDMLFMSEPRKIAITEAIGVVGCLHDVTCGDIDESSEVHLSLNLHATHMFNPKDPNVKQRYGASVVTPLSHVQYIEHDPSSWGRGI